MLTDKEIEEAFEKWLHEKDFGPNYYRKSQLAFMKKAWIAAYREALENLNV